MQHKPVMTAAYATAYGIRSPLGPSAVHNIWAETIQNVGYTALRPRRGKAGALAVENVIIPREHLLGFHQRLVAASKAKPLPLVDGPQPSYIGTPELSLIHRIGVELEGGWRTDQIATNHLRIKHDSSVRVPDPSAQSADSDESVCDDPDCDNEACVEARERTNEPAELDAMPEQWTGALKNGELEFGPFSPGSLAGRADDFARCYPLLTNDTCGQHVHFSFPTTGTYGAFVREDFRPWLIDGLQRFLDAEHTAGAAMPPGLEGRLNGRNQYCQAIYSPEQIWGSGDRYGQVNYCYSKHRTMEIRVLPMFASASQSQATIAELVRLVALWANAFAPQPRKPRLLGQAELTTNEAVVVDEAPLPRVAGEVVVSLRELPGQAIRCPGCDHNINACRGYLMANNWTRLQGWAANQTREYEGNYRCCSCGHFISPISGQVFLQLEAIRTRAVL